LKAWRGKCLVVDLTRGLIKTASLPRRLLESFMGGRGLGVKLVYDLAPRRVDAYHEDNVIVLSTGPLTGTKFYGSHRFAVVSKSPLTGTIFDSSCGGEWGSQLKAAGLDALVIRGRAKALSALIIDEGEARMVNVEHMAGLSTVEAEAQLQRDLGREFRVVCIGPAGENLVRMACIRAGEGHVAGRGGLGAVMGSKRVKAIAVRGSKSLEVHDEEKLRNLCLLAFKRLQSNPITGKALPSLGTSFLLRLINEHRMLPAYNYKQPFFEGSHEISAEIFKSSFYKRRKGCPNCPIACKRLVEVDGVEGSQPEFESLWALGPACGLSSPKELIELTWLCDKLGLDTISTGATIACAMELTELGLLRPGVGWGDSEAMKKLLVDVANRRELGDLLAEGSRRLAERLGKPEVSMNVKGLELPAYDPRGVYGQALAYATSNRGGCHLRAYMVAGEVLGVPVLLDRRDPVGKAELVAFYENFFAAIDSMVVCKFLALELDEEVFAEALKAATGLPFTKASLLEIGERIYNLERLFNVEEGFSRVHDTLPERILCSPDAPPLSDMLKAYYAVRGWSEEGVPSEDKLIELGLPGERVEV